MAKYTDKQIAEIFIQSLEESKDTVKKQEKVAHGIHQELNAFLVKLENTRPKVDDASVRQAIVDFNRISTANQQGVNITRFAYGLIFVAVLVLGVSYYFCYLQSKSKSEIIEEYRRDLKKENLLLIKEDSEFIEKLKLWRDKNPNDWERLVNSIDNQRY